jgi:endonuclease YncB( thermonuclease family)
MFRLLLLVSLLGLAVACTACAVDDADLLIDASLTRVVDGDTLQVQLSSGPETVRLYGVDTPEARAPFGREATRALHTLVGRGALQLQPVTDDPDDKYDRLVAVVYADGVNVSEALVADGLAWAYRRYLGQVTGAESLCRLEAEARAARKGLWSQPPERWVPPWIYRARSRALPGASVPSKDYSRETADDCIAAIAAGAAPTSPVSVPRNPPPTKTPPGAEPDSGCRIKGNINRKGERIYHLPGSHGYDDTRIDTAKGERWFCSEEEARAAGWRGVQ